MEIIACVCVSLSSNFGGKQINDRCYSQNRTLSHTNVFNLRFTIFKFKPTQSNDLHFTHTIMILSSGVAAIKTCGARSHIVSTHGERNEGNNERRKRRERQETEEIKEVKHEKISQSWR